MEDSYETSGSEMNSSNDSGRESGYDIPIPPVAFSRSFSNVTGKLIWSYRWFQPRGDLDFTGDLFSVVHIIAHPFSNVHPEKWSTSQVLALRSLSPETAYEVHQSIRCAIPIEQLARSVFVPFEPYPEIEHDLVGLLMGTEMVQHIIAHVDVKQLTSLFACYYMTDGHNRCEYYLSMSP